MTNRPAPTFVTAQLAPDVELLGPYPDSGLEQPPYLVRRGGRMLQVSRLLHTVAAAADGTRNLDEMAAVAATELDRPLTGDDIAFLVEAKLVPAGIVRLDGEPHRSTVPAPAPDPDQRLLALRFRRPLVSADQMEAGARRLTPLFRPWVVAGVLAALAAFDVWLFGSHGVRHLMTGVVRQPGSLLLIMGLVCLSGVAHELGHAAGCRYSGGRPGPAGIGLYLWWPVMYSNVTDTYRLNRRGRLRTDLGGIYFNAVFTLAVAGAYAATGFDVLLAVVVFEHVLVLQQLVPWVRFDGYYIVSDLTGVPDILSRARPALASLIPGRPSHPAVRALRPRARRLLFAYFASLVLFLGVVVVPSLSLFPRMLAAEWTALGPHGAALRAAAGQWDTIMVVVDAVALAILALPFVGLALTAGVVGARLMGGTVHLARRMAVGRRRRRRAAPVLPGAGAPDLSLVGGTDLPGGGRVDWFGFGFDGELALFGADADRLVAAAGELVSYTADKLDRLLIDGPPFAETVARAARATGRAWDEPAFRARLDETLAHHGFTLVALGRKSSQN